MVSDTRSGRQINDDLDGSSSKKKLINGKGLSPCSSGKADVLGVRRSARESSSSRLTTPNPESTRKSKRLEKGTPSTPLVKRKSERLEKQNTLSPLRRSDRGKKNMSSSSSGSQQSAKEFKLSDPKRKKEKNWIHVTMESEKDADGELEGPSKLSRACGDNNSGVGSEAMGKGEDVSYECCGREVGKWRDESSDNVYDGALPKSISILNGSDADILGRYINLDSKHMNNVVNESPKAPDGGGFKHSKTSSSIREIFNDSERLPVNCTSINNMDAPQSVSSTCLERLLDGVINSGSVEECTSPKGMAYAMYTNLDLTVINAGKDGFLAVTETTPHAKRENHSLLGTCVICSKKKRGSCSQHRKRVQYLDGSPVTENDDVGKKRIRVVNDNVNPASVQLELGEHQVTQVAGSKEGGPTIIIASNQSQPLQVDSVTSNSNPNCKYGQSSCGPEVDVGESSERIVPFDELKSLHSFLKGETTRLCQILKLSEDVMDMVRTILEYVIKNHKVSTDSPAYVHALQISLCWIAASILKQKVDKKDSLMLAKQLLNYQCTEEQANSVYAKMRSLKRIYLNCSENLIVFGKNDLLAEEDISKEPSNVNEVVSHFSSFELQNFKVEIEEESANEEHAEDQILLWQKMVMNDKAAGSEIENKIKKIKKKCDKRMKKLIRKHQEEIQEFHQIWKDKKNEMEADHRLKSAVIRSIHGQGSVRMDKLKLLTDNFAKKMEEHNLVKDMELKDLEVKQLDARNEERQKAAHWLAQAKACVSELKAVNGPQSLGCQSEEDAGCLQSSTRIAFNGPMDVVSMSSMQTVDQNPSKSACMRGNDVALSNACISAPAEAVCCSAPFETSKHSSDPDEIVSVDPPAAGQQISDEIRSVNLSKELPKVVPETVLNEVVGHAHPLLLGNASNKEYDNGDAIGLLDALENPRNGPDEATIGDLPFHGQQLVLPEQIVASPDRCGLFSQQVPQGQIPQTLVSSELHDQDAPVVENLSTSQIGVSTSELVDTVTPVQLDHEASVTENCEQLHPVSVVVSFSCNQSPAYEVLHQNNDEGRSSFQTAEAGETEVLLHEPVSQSRENLEVHPNHLDLDPVNRVAEFPIQAGLNLGIDADPVNRVAELPIQAGLNLGIDADHPHGSGYPLTHPIHQVTTWNSTPSLFAEPLQTELERIRKETEQLEKSQEDMMSQLKSDCEEKIQEIITHIRNECEVKLKDAEAEFRLKKNELDKNQTKVLMNKMLANAFRSKCLDFRSSGLPGMQQGIPRSFMQHLHQLSLSPSMRPPGGVQACQPVPSLQATTPAAQVMPAMQQLSSSQSMRPSLVASQNFTAPPVRAMRPSPVASQNFTAPPVQAVHRAAAVSSSTPSRSPVISAITPSGNPRVGGEIRSPAPHLQPFRPASASSVPLSISLSTSQYPPQKILNSQPFQLPLPSSVQQQSTNFVSQIRPEPQSGLPSPHLALSAVELLMDMDNLPHSDSANYTLPPFPDVGLLEPSDLGNVEASSAVATDVVCLSDDE